MKTWYCKSVSFTNRLVVCSAYPKSGGVYYWTAALCRPKYVPIVSFFTGWFNLIGYLAGLASASFGMALLTSATATLATDGEWTATPGVIVGIYISVLFTQGLINTYANGTISLMMVVSSKSKRPPIRACIYVTQVFQFGIHRAKQPLTNLYI